MGYLRLVAVFLRIGTLNELAYRANFFIQILESLVGVATILGTVAVVFSQTDTLGGWLPAELIALVGVYYLVLGMITLVISPSLARFISDVQQGTLDFTLLKPEDAQLLVSISEIRIWKLIDIGVGVVVLSGALVQLTSEIGVGAVLSFGIALLTGATIVYCFYLMLASLAFWFIRVENLLQIFWAMYTAGRWPVGIYPGWLRWILTLVVPIAFAVTVPAEAIAGRLTLQTQLGSILLAGFLVLFSRWFWTQGLRQYSGASA